jgi:superfamily II DNA helicase RecQ
MMHKTLPEFRAQLQNLEQRALLRYEPEKSGCAITLTQPRPENKHLTFPKAFVDSWIHSKAQRTQAMIDLLSTEECIVQFVESYFGQAKQAPCGSCSSCQMDHYPSPEKVKEMLASGLALDDIWFDLNCSPDELRNA